jgi:hypothetical protein
MPLRRPLVFYVAFVMQTACASAQVTAPSNDAQAKETFVVTLRAGESRRVGGTPITVAFEALVEDSRCPRGVNCVWEGDAAVRVRIEGGQAARQTPTLHVNPRFTSEAAHDGYLVTLTDVAPYPESDRQTAPGDYRITLRVTAT